MDNQNRSIRNIFFDLDGTLVNSLTEITASLNKMRQHFKLTLVDNKRVAKVIGSGLLNTIKSLFYNNDTETMVENINQVLKLTKNFYAKNLGNSTYVYPGVIETLTQLKMKGINLAIVTNAEEEHAIKLLSKLNLLSFFQLIVGGNTTSSYKPSPLPLEYAMKKLRASKDNSVMVGDSKNDYLCAKAVNILCVFITHGYHYNFDFDKHKPYRVIDRFEKLLKVVGL